MNIFQELNRFLVSCNSFFDMSKWVILFTKSYLTDVDTFLETNTWIKDAYTTLIPVSIGLMLMYCLTTLIEHTIVQETTLDEIVRFFIKFCAGSVLINNGYDLLIGIVSFGSKIADYISINVEYTDRVAQSVQKAPLLEILWNILELPGTLVSILVVSIIVIFVMMVRQVEITIYTAIAPLAMSDCMSKKFTETNAFRFLKIYLALALQSVIIVLALYMASRFETHLTTAISAGIQVWGILKHIPKVGWFSLLNSSYIYGLFIIFLIGKSKSMARSLLGV